jgi:hypothetical protein
MKTHIAVTTFVLIATSCGFAETHKPLDDASTNVIVTNNDEVMTIEREYSPSFVQVCTGEMLCNGEPDPDDYVPVSVEVQHVLSTPIVFHVVDSGTFNDVLSDVVTEQDVQDADVAADANVDSSDDR